MGGRADAAGRQGLAQPRARRLGVLHRRARLALSLSLAAAPGRADRGGLRRTRQALEADPRRLRRCRRRSSATRSIPARTCSTARPSRCSSTRSATTRAATSTTTRRTSCCSSSTISTSSTSTTSASRRFTSRTPSSTRPAGRASIPAIRAGSNRAGRFRSLGDGQVDFGGIFSKLAQYGYDGWAVLEWECCLKHPEDGRRGRRALHRPPHHPRHREGLRRLRRRHDRQEAAARHDGHLSAANRRGRERSWPSKAAGASATRAPSASAWWAAARAPSSAPCTASPRASTTSTSWSPARSPPTRQRAKASAAELGLAPDRIYGSFKEMAKAEARRADGIEAVADRHAEPHALSRRPRPSWRPASTSSATSR